MHSQGSISPIRRRLGSLRYVGVRYIRLFRRRPWCGHVTRLHSAAVRESRKLGHGGLAERSGHGSPNAKNARSATNRPSVTAITTTMAVTITAPFHFTSAQRTAPFRNDNDNDNTFANMDHTRGSSSTQIGLDVWQKSINKHKEKTARTALGAEARRLCI